MISQQNMYQLFYDNQNYLDFIINNYFKKVETNEKTYSALLNNNIYLKFLVETKYFNNETQKIILKTLNRFDDKFWLKNCSMAFFKVIKYVKNKNLSVSMACKIVDEEKLVNGFYAYLKKLELLSKIPQETLMKINEIYENLGINFAILYLIKNKLVK